MILLRVGRHLQRSDCLAYWLDFHPKDALNRISLMRTQGISIFATHNPYIVDLFDVSEVRCEVRRFRGDVILHAQLNEHPDWPGMDGALSPGEFWGQVGEEWVMKLRGTA
jgi:hypothetical protein